MFVALRIVDAEAGRTDRPELGVVADLAVEIVGVVALVKILPAGGERQAESGRVVKDRGGAGIGVVDAVLVRIVDGGGGEQR